MKAGRAELGWPGERGGGHACGRNRRVPTRDVVREFSEPAP